MKKDCIIGSEDEGLGYSLKIRKFRESFIINLERFIEKPKVLNLPLLEQLLKRFKVLLQLIIIKRHKSIISVNRL